MRDLLYLFLFVGAIFAQILGTGYWIDFFHKRFVFDKFRCIIVKDIVMLFIAPVGLLMTMIVYVIVVIIVTSSELFEPLLSKRIFKDKRGR